jgi:lipopolysaccharide biosynthesis protein
MKKFRPLAIVLPQFHPTPENDEWWGKGFTEWTNVTKAKPSFKGHYQPHLPADLGFYDMRLAETRQQQANMAKDYGIEGFCYYHYWFNGKRVLHEPMDRILASKEPDFPFMLCWANENWTRSWDGRTSTVLLEQNYSKTDDLAHIEWLCQNVFNDPRYITIDNKPVISIYRANLFPNIAETLATWRTRAKELGFEGLYICGVKTMGSFNTPEEAGFDAAIDFQPDWSQFQKDSLWWKFKYRFNLAKNHLLKFDYKTITDKMMARPKPTYKEFPSIIPAWDNSARRKTGALVVNNSTPKLFGRWFDFIFNNFKPYSKEENLVFINAWNEWAEGNHLEPDQKWGLAYLEEAKKSIEKHQ